LVAVEVVHDEAIGGEPEPVAQIVGTDPVVLEVVCTARTLHFFGEL
jgi:hypothetical protein